MKNKIISIEDDLLTFKECCPEIFLNNKIQIFNKFFCPISIVEADVKEYIIDEYESVELLILRLFDSGVVLPDMISALTGLDVNLINKLIFAEMYTYGHIDPNTKSLTIAGLNTLEENKNADNLFQYALYNVKREIQVDSVTGTIIKAEKEMDKDKMPFFNDRLEPYILPREAVYIDEELKRELEERLQYYIDKEYISEGNTINEIYDLRTREIRYRVAYYVYMQGFSCPFISIPYYGIEGKRRKRCVAPIAIAESDVRFVNNTDNKYLQRADDTFEYLSKYMDKFENTLNINDEIIQSIIEESLDYEDEASDKEQMKDIDNIDLFDNETDVDVQ